MCPSFVVFVLLVSLIEASMIVNLNQAQHGAYSQWKSQYFRSYQSGEVEAYRLSLWLENYNKVDQHNTKFQQGEVSYSVAINQFADMPHDQIVDSYFYYYDDSSFETTCTAHQDPFTQEEDFIHSTSTFKFDQRTNNNICGSGWAMAPSITLSIAYTNQFRSIKNSTSTITFSPQQLIDCTTGAYGGNGCEGGSVYKTWQFYSNIGAVLNSSYPYLATQSTCNTSKTPLFKISNCISVTSNSEFSLRNSVALTPVTVQMNGDAWGFMSYSGGIYDGSDCNDVNINHSISIVGFSYETDFDFDGNAYNATFWVGVNSFGVSWGESGNVRLSRTEGDTSTGTCGMYKYPSYPLL